ncbi:hypothetical protein MVEN_01903400 [Mycena venus]|uniref:Transmembrane protein n=1 Tax=Mycena venus TaxID=2733690 RepID=A0A8H7CKV2_9AGAR|nr:hypothetical protein MVEN_01903400 [Mycena venus]
MRRGQDAVSGPLALSPTTDRALPCVSVFRFPPLSSSLFPISLTDFIPLSLCLLSIPVFHLIFLPLFKSSHEYDGCG